MALTKTTAQTFADHPNPSSLPMMVIKNAHRNKEKKYQGIQGAQSHSSPKH
jgi:hypothetical protein